MLLSPQVLQGARNQHTHRSSEFLIQQSYFLYVNDRRSLITLFRNEEHKRCIDSLERCSIHSFTPHSHLIPMLSLGPGSQHTLFHCRSMSDLSLRNGNFTPPYRRSWARKAHCSRIWNKYRASPCGKLGGLNLGCPPLRQRHDLSSPCGKVRCLGLSCLPLR